MRIARSSRAMTAEFVKRRATLCRRGNKTNGRPRRRPSPAAQRVRLPVVPRGAGRDRRGHPGRPRRARDDADRQRQVAVLPASGAAPRRPDRRGLAADRADAQPGGAVARLRHRRGEPELGATISENRDMLEADRGRRTAARLHRAGTAGESRHAGDLLRARQGRAAGGRRGALHLAMGARLPPRICGARQPCRRRSAASRRWPSPRRPMPRPAAIS